MPLITYRGRLLSNQWSLYVTGGMELFAFKQIIPPSTNQEVKIK
ncbi:hypothetical protein [Vagococcus salmoninarum]|nr:hypothetical protein [Vagococcus salmoninarum]